jgi:hypothetical protein
MKNETGANRESLFELHGASRCPVCFLPPYLSIEPAVYPTLQKSEDYILRCPQDHPYIAMGDDVQMAVRNWNIYLAGRAAQANSVKRVPADSLLSNCKQCLRYTRSELRLVDGDMIEQCSVCRLDKSVKETD